MTWSIATVALILLCGDSEALAVAPMVGATKRAEDTVDVIGRVGSRIEDWGGDGGLLARALAARRKTDFIVLFLGTNHWQDKTAPDVSSVTEIARRTCPLVWVGPAKIGGGALPVSYWLKDALNHRALFIDSSKYDIEMRADTGQSSDMWHPSGKGARDWLQLVWSRIPSSQTSDIPNEFFTEGDAMAKRLGIDFVHLLYVMNFESAGVFPHIKGGGYGLIQLQNLAGVGWTGTPDDFLKLGATEQLPYIETYLSRFKNYRLDNAVRLWQSILVPATLDEASPVLLRETGLRWNGKEQAFYHDNKGLDRGRKHYITTDDLEQSLTEQARKSRFQELLRRYSDLTGYTMPTMSSVMGASPRQNLEGVAQVAVIIGAIVSMVYLADRSKYLGSGIRRAA